MINKKIIDGKSTSKLREILETEKYVQQDRMEGFKETLKPITDELKNLDTGVSLLKDQLKEELKINEKVLRKKFEPPPSFSEATYDEVLGIQMQEGTDYASKI